MPSDSKSSFYGYWNRGSGNKMKQKEANHIFKKRYRQQKMETFLSSRRKGYTDNDRKRPRTMRYGFALGTFEHWTEKGVTEAHGDEMHKKKRARGKEKLVRQLQPIKTWILEKGLLLEARHNWPLVDRLSRSACEYLIDLTRWDIWSCWYVTLILM